MPNYKSLSDSELLLGYKNVILFYESEVKNRPQGVSIKKLRPLIKDEATLFPVDNISDVIAHESMNDFEQNPVGFFTFHIGNRARVPSLLNHLRNSFAHGLVSREKINNIDFFCFEDYGQVRNGARPCTMKGQIRVAHFSPFIEKIKQSYLVCRNQNVK